MRLLLKLSVGFLILICLAGVGGYLWLRASPHWAGITLFAEDKRVANFRSMEHVFPTRPVAAGGEIWSFDEAPRPLPDSYPYQGSDRSLATFLDDTVTTGFLVAVDGTIVHETYRLGAEATSRFTSWSVAKSVLSALIGIAIDEGHIGGLDDPLTQYIPELAGSGYDGVSIKDALTMSSGVAFDETYDSFTSDVNQLFSALARGQEMVQVLAALERERPPGTYNNYISSDSIALGLALEAATGVPNEDYMSSRLWQPMGAEHSAHWNTGRASGVLPFCCLNATLRDYARFGRLFLNAGARDGVQIVPRAWVRDATRPTAPHLEPGENPASFWTFGYGYHWWVPEDPQGDFLAIGIWGQFVYVHPARRVVIVKTSADAGFDDRDHETVAVFRAIAAHVGQASE